MMEPQRTPRRLTAVVIDRESIGKGTPEQEQERAVAIHDLVEHNSFALPGHDGGPYRLRIALQDAKLALIVDDQRDSTLAAHIISLAPFRKILKDYFLICETYYAALRTSTAQQIEAIDMGRRALHDEGAQLLAQRLNGKIECDFETVRRLFTLITAIHWKG